MNMASLVSDKNGFRVVVTIGGRRRTRRLGHIKKSDAHAFQNLLEDLVVDSRIGRPHDEATTAQLNRLSQKSRDQLATLGLIRGIEVGIRLDAVLQRYVDQIRGKPATKKSYMSVQRNLNGYFPGRLLASITPTEAERFRAYLADQALAEATISRRVIACRTIWHWAVAQDLAATNPFVGVHAGQQTNPKRKAYVETSTVETLIEHANPEMRLALCLSRYAGLRVPSELLTLQWEHIDFGGNRMTVHSPKTEQHADGASRVVPLFPHVRRYLGPMRSRSGHVFVNNRRAQSWWKSLRDLCKRCGVPPWKKLWHNMRASCQTDLNRGFPAHVVCSWLGNSLRVAERHYLQTTEADLVRALSWTHSGSDKSEQGKSEDTRTRSVPGSAAVREKMGQLEFVVQELQRLTALVAALGSSSDASHSSGTTSS